MATQAPDHEQARRVAVSIVRRLRDRGHAAYFAGGCVRDELLGLAPKDYDVATNATPTRLHELFRRVTEVGAAFGVALVRDEGVTVEVATFREESGYSDQRRPDEVRFSSSDRDARRRDFTINALFLDPLNSPANDPNAAGAMVADGPEGGRVVDFVGGLADLQSRVIRAVGDPDARLAEDHLRALRAARFGARLGVRGFAIEGRTADAVRRHASELSGVSRERIGDELRRMLLDPTATRAAELLEQLELAGPALGEVGTKAPQRREGAPPTLGRLRDPVGGDGAVLYATRLAAWLLDRWPQQPAMAPVIDALAGDVVRRTRAALCLTNHERSALRDALSGLCDLETGWSGRTTAARKRSVASGWFGSAIELLRARDKRAAEKIDQLVAALAATPGGIAPEAFVTGDDLVRLGAEQGPIVGAMLSRLYDEQLEGRVLNREQALERAAEWIGAGSGRDSTE